MRYILNFAVTIKSIIIILFIANLSLAQMGISENYNIGSLTIIITGFSNNNGNCRIALDNSREIYESDEKVFIGKVIPIINQNVVITIDSLEFGEYAVKVFHDENNNSVLDLNFLGIPVENYGYSNNASSWFGPPRWEKAVFKFDKDYKILTIAID